MRTVLLAAVALLAISCSKGDDPSSKNNFYLSPNAMIYIKPALEPLAKSSNPEDLSALEIVKQTNGIIFRNEVLWGDQDATCGFAKSQRDTTSNPPMLKRWASDLITLDPYGKYYLVPDFMDAHDVVFFRVLLGPIDYTGRPVQLRDTIAYTPNAIMKQIQNDVRAALANKDTTLAYKAFNSWTFTPITAAEYRALKAQGKQ